MKSTIKQTWNYEIDYETNLKLEKRNYEIVWIQLVEFIRLNRLWNQYEFKYKKILKCLWNDYEIKINSCMNFVDALWWYELTMNCHV